MRIQTWIYLLLAVAVFYAPLIGGCLLLAVVVRHLWTVQKHKVGSDDANKNG